MALPFELVIEQAPVSNQARRRERRDRWIRSVESAARDIWGLEAPVTEPVMVTITYIFDDTPLDVDNVSKPILDALEGVVFEDDAQVFDLLCRKRHVMRILSIGIPSGKLVDIAINPREAVHIQVDALESPGVAL